MPCLLQNLYIHREELNELLHLTLQRRESLLVKCLKLLDLGEVPMNLT